MALKKYHVSKNLFDYKTTTPYKGSFDNNGVFYATDNDDATSLIFKIQLYSGTSPIQSSTRAVTVNATGTYRITSAIKVTSDVTRIRFANNGRSSEFSIYCYIDATKFLDEYISIVFTVDNTTIGASVISDIMFYKGNAALNYEPFVTDNLFNEIYPNIDSSLHYSVIYVGDGQFTMSTSCPRNQSGACLFFLAGNVSSGASTESNGVWGYSGTSYGTMTRTQTAVNGYVTVAYRSLTTELNPVNEDTMVNSGSTAKTYMPYGTTWQDIPYRRYETATDAVTNLPVTLYTDGQPIAANLLNVTQANSIYYANYNNYTVVNNIATTTGNALFGFKAKVDGNKQYSVGALSDKNIQMRIREYSAEPQDWSTDFVVQSLSMPMLANTRTTAEFTTDSQSKYVLVVFYADALYAPCTLSEIMLNEGSTAIPYQPYAPWVMKGNTETSGTPSPSNPITIDGVGNKTANLSSGSIANSVINTSGVVEASQSYTTIYAPVTAGQTYTFAYTASNVDVNYIYGFFTALPSIGSTTYNNSRTVVSYSTSSTITFEAPSGVSYIGMRIPNAAITAGKSIMINEGSVLQPFEPSGYEITITSNGTALTPVYINEPLLKIGSRNDELNSNNMLLRKIRKIVCNGSENWNVYSAGTSLSFFYLSISNNKGINTLIMCTHYERNAIDTASSTVGIDLVSDGTIIRLRPQNVTSDFPDLNSWTTYLQQQYENGTPLTIWYALNTAATETVTVPTIPTTGGTATIDVDTTVKPSEMDLTYHGWHTHEPKKYVGGAVNKFNYLTMISGGVIGKYLNSNGAAIESSNWSITDYIPCNGTTFTLYPIGGNAPAICLYNNNKQLIVAKSYNSGGSETKIPVTITSSSIANYVRFSYYSGDGGDDLSQIMLVEGSTVPSEYHPYYEWVEQ